MKRRALLELVPASLAAAAGASCGGGGASSSGVSQLGDSGSPSGQTSLAVVNVGTGEQIPSGARVATMAKVRIEADPSLSVQIRTGYADLPANRQIGTARSYLARDAFNPNEYWLPVQIGETSVEIELVRNTRTTAGLQSDVVAHQALTLISAPAGQIPGQVSESYFMASIQHKDEAIAGMQEAGDSPDVLDAVIASRDQAQQTLDMIQEVMMYGQYEVGFDSSQGVYLVTPAHLQELDQLIIGEAERVISGDHLPYTVVRADRQRSILDLFVRSAYAQSSSCSSSLPVSPQNAAYRANIVAACLADMRQYELERQAAYIKIGAEAVNFIANVATVLSPLGALSVGRLAVRIPAVAKYATSMAYGISRAADTVSILAKAQNGQTGEAFTELGNVAIDLAVDKLTKLDSTEMLRLVQRFPGDVPLRESISIGLSKATEKMYKSQTKEGIRTIGQNIKSKKRKSVKIAPVPRKNAPIVPGAPPLRPPTPTLRTAYTPPAPPPASTQGPGLVYLPSYDPIPSIGGAGGAK